MHKDYFVIESDVDSSEVRIYAPGSSKLDKRDENYLIALVQIAIKEIKRKFRNIDRSEIVQLKATKSGSPHTLKGGDLVYFVENDDCISLYTPDKNKYIIKIDTKNRTLDSYLVEVLNQSMIKTIPHLKNMKKFNQKMDHVNLFLDSWKKKFSGFLSSKK